MRGPGCWLLSGAPFLPVDLTPWKEAPSLSSDGETVAAPPVQSPGPAKGGSCEASLRSHSWLERQTMKYCPFLLLFNLVAAHYPRGGRPGGL